MGMLRKAEDVLKINSLFMTSCNVSGICILQMI